MSDEKDFSTFEDLMAETEKEAVAVEVKEEEVKEEAPKPKRKYKKRAKKSAPKKEVKEEVKEEAPKPARKSAPVKPDYAYAPWWKEVGSALAMRGYSLVGICNRAKRAFGSKFDQAKYDAYIQENGITGNDKVEAIWKSQK